MAYSDTLKIFGVLRQKFDEPEAKVIAEAVESALEANNTELFQTVSTKADIAQLRIEMREMKAELIKWMFIFWVGQFASITAILFLFFRK